jgi:protein arginine kinase activator
MKCQICNKNEANIVFTQIIDNEKIVLNICSECAKIKGITVEIGKPSMPKADDFSFDDSYEDKEEKADESTEEKIFCESCGLSFAEFRKSGLFGCENCHLAFGEYIPNLLKQIHGTEVYKGNKPGELSEEAKLINRLNRFRSELKRCIETEDYEQAAKLRDSIAVLEKDILKK